MEMITLKFNRIITNEVKRKSTANKTVLVMHILSVQGKKDHGNLSFEYILDSALAV